MQLFSSVGIARLWAIVGNYDCKESSQSIWKHIIFNGGAIVRVGNYLLVECSSSAGSYSSLASFSIKEKVIYPLHK